MTIVQLVVRVNGRGFAAPYSDDNARRVFQYHQGRCKAVVVDNGRERVLDCRVLPDGRVQVRV